MALFESQPKRNARLFNGAFEALVRGIPESILDWPEKRRQEYISWYAGGSAAAVSAVRNCQPLTQAWGKGDKDRSSQLTLLFTMPVILRFYGYDSRMGLDERMNLLSYSLTGLLEIQTDLPNAPKRMVDEYLELAKQFEFDEHAVPEPGGVVLRYSLEMDYLLDKALVALGRPAEFSFGEAGLPVRGSREFWQAGGKQTVHFTDLHAYDAMFVAVGVGFTASMEVLRTLRGSQIENEAKGTKW